MKARGTLISDSQAILHWLISYATVAWTNRNWAEAEETLTNLHEALLASFLLLGDLRAKELRHFHMEKEKGKAHGEVKQICLRCFRSRCD